MRFALLFVSLLSAHLACAQSERAFADALRLGAGGNSSAAVDALKQIILTDPSFARAYHVLVQMQSSDRAPELREWLRGLGTPGSCIGLIELARVRKEYTSGDAEARSCTANSPQSLAVYSRWVTLARDSKHVLELASELARQSASKPDSAALQYAAGFAYCLAYRDIRIPQNYDLAQTYLERAASLEPDSDEIDDAFFYLNDEKDPALAAAAARRLLDRARLRGDREWAYRAAGRLAQSDLLRSDFPKALEEYTEALAGARELGRNIVAGGYIVDIGECLFRLGRFEESIAAFEEGLRNPYVESQSTGWLAEVHRHLGNYAEALTYAERAFQLARQLKQRRQIAFRATNLAFTWLELGLSERALEAAREAQSALEGETSNLWRGRILVDVGNILAQLGRTQEAAAAFSTAVQLAATGHDAIAESEARILRAELLTNAGRFADAASELAAAQTLVTTKQRYAQWKLAAARLALREKHFSDAAAAFDDAVRTARELPSPTLLWQGHAGLSDVFWQQGNFADALKERQQAIDVIEAIRGNLISPDQRAGFLAGRVQLYKDVTRLNLRLRNPTAAFEASERGRARALLDLADDRPTPATSTRRELDQRIRELGAIRNKDANPENLRAAELNLQTATDRYLASLAANGVRTVPAVASEQIRKQLQPGTTLLYYTLDQPASALFAVSRNRLRVYSLPPRASIEAEVREVHSLLSANPSRLAQRRLFEGLQNLYRILVAPAAAELAGTRQIVVVPDGMLNYLPFEALVAPGSGDFDDWSSLPYLIRNFELRYAPSAAIAIQNAAGFRKTSGTLLAYGDPRASSQPLPFSRREIEGLSAFYPAAKQRVVLGAAATKAALKSDPALAQSSVLHFALHGMIDEHWPQMSGLVFSSTGAGDDGILRIYEILRMRLQAQTVVLSACETSLGPAIEGEGLASLRRAFLMAGAKSIVASLWKVDDEATAELMVRFHSHLSQAGTNGARALRDAELEMLASKTYTHPHYWSAFGISGRAD